MSPGIGIGIGTPFTSGRGGGIPPNTLVAADATYLFTGQVASFSLAHKIVLAGASFTYNGQAATLAILDHVLSAGNAAFTMTGQAAALTIAPAPGHLEIITEFGQFNYSGDTMTPIIDYAIIAGAASFAFSGQSALPEFNRKLVAGAASFTFTGQAATLSKSTTAEASAFLARTTGLDATHTAAYETLINGLVADGVFSKLDALWILATQDATTAGLNLKSTSFTLSPTNSPTFTADQGYSGNGSTQSISTGFAPASSGTNFSQNSASISAYIRTSRTTSNSSNIMGAQPTSGGTAFYIAPLQSSNFGWSLNGTTFPSAANTNAQGYWSVSRTASNAMSVRKNGAAFTTNSGNSGALTNMTNAVRLLSNTSSGGVGASFSTDQLAAAHIGGALTTTEQDALASRINAFMTTVGANVY